MACSYDSEEVVGYKIELMGLDRTENQNMILKFMWPTQMGGTRLYLLRCATLESSEDICKVDGVITMIGVVKHQ